MKKHGFPFMLLNIVGASLMLTLNDERKKREIRTFCFVVTIE